MHVAINALLLNTNAGYRSAGVSNYSRHLLCELGRQVLAGQAAVDLTAYVSTPRFETPGIQAVYTGSLLQHPAARIGWEQGWLPRQLHADRADLVHGLVNVLPLGTDVAGVITVHDLSFLRMPDKFLPVKRGYLARLCGASSHKARQVIAVSRQTADDLVAYFHVPVSKISVIHNGVAARFRPVDAADIAEFRRGHGLPARYLLYLGTLEPRKNLVRLVRAFARWRGQAGPADSDVKLVLAGAKGWYYEEIFGEVRRQRLEDLVLFPGYVAEEELPFWYQAAVGFVYPSLFEGFGLPVLEAMACGTPVLCSRTPALVEVVGDSALTFPGESEDDLAAGLALLTGQPALWQELRLRGLARARRFSWQRAAAATLDVYTAAAR